MDPKVRQRQTNIFSNKILSMVSPVLFTMAVIWPSATCSRLANVTELITYRIFRTFRSGGFSRMKDKAMSDEKPMGHVVQIDEARIRDHLGEMVRGTETTEGNWRTRTPG